tara:strand:+ start:317 stop:943 length:627 start_codon:yes stop_codon:yes gene_type:complete
MLISDTHKFVFVHIRKAAGSSLRQILERVSLQKNNHIWYKLISRIGVEIDYHKHSFRQHSPLVEAERSMPSELFQQYYKFAIVRNPWDRLVSEYEYIKTQPSHSRFKKLSKMKFEDYVIYQSKRPAAYQVNALKLSNGQLGCDFIGRFEDLNNSMNEISERINIDLKNLPHINKTEHRDYSIYYDNSLKDLVREIWHEDITTFGYYFK